MSVISLARDGHEEDVLTIEREREGSPGKQLRHYSSLSTLNSEDCRDYKNNGTYFNKNNFIVHKPIERG